MSTLNADDKTLSHAEDLASEVERLTARIAELEGYFAAPDILTGRYNGVKVAVLVGGPRTELNYRAQYMEGPLKGKNIRLKHEEIEWIDPIIITTQGHLQTLTDRIKELEDSR